MADTALENAQSLCERGAHQFLREGDCEAEIAGAKESFEQSKRLADQELVGLREEQERRKQLEEVKEKQQFGGFEENPGMALEADDNVESDEEDTTDIMLNMQRYGIRSTRRMP